jgi:hypothetical protein
VCLLRSSDEASVDALADDLERDALRRPAAHALEGRSNDPDQVPVVLAAKNSSRFRGNTRRWSSRPVSFPHHAQANAASSRDRHAR